MVIYGKAYVLLLSKRVATNFLLVLVSRWEAVEETLWCYAYRFEHNIMCFDATPLLTWVPVGENRFLTVVI